MINPEEKEYQDLIEYMRLAYIAAIESAEATIKSVNKKSEHISDIFIRLRGKGKLVNLFKKYASQIPSDDKIYQLNQAQIVKWKGTIGYELRIDFPFAARTERPILEKAYKAIHYIVLQIDPDSQLVIVP